MAAPFQNVSAKTLRISFVWLVGAVLTLVWATVDWVSTIAIPEGWVSAVTALAMGLALFWDMKRGQDDDVVIVDPGEHNDG